MSEESSRSYTQDTNELSLREVILKIREWWFYILSKWVLVVGLVFLGGVAGILYALTVKPQYHANLSFALEDDAAGGGMGGGALGLASQFGLDLGGGGGGAFSGDNLIELMKSRSMVEKTLLTTVKLDGEEQTLAEYYIKFNKLRESWEEKGELSKIQFPPYAERNKFSRLQDSVLGLFHRDIIKNSLDVAKLDKKLSIITVQFSSPNENFSKYFCDVLVKEVADFYVETKTKKSVDNLFILQHQTDSVKRMLNNAIAGVAYSMDSNPNPNPAMRRLQVPSQRKQVDVQANQVILTEMVKNLEIAKISLRNERPLIQIIDVPRFPLDKTGLGKTKSALIGAVLVGLLTVVTLIIIRIYRQLING